MFGVNKDDGSAASAQAMGQMMDDPALLDSAASMMSAPTTTDPAFTGGPTATPPSVETPTSTPSNPFTSSQPVINDVTPPSTDSQATTGITPPAPHIDNPAPAWTPDVPKPEISPVNVTPSSSSSDEDTSTDEDKFSIAVPAPLNDTPTEDPKPTTDTPKEDSSSEDASTPDPAPATKNIDTGDLANIKEQALKALQPLVTKLEQTPEEEFRTIMMMIQASDDHTLIDKAYKAAQNITDEKAKAQALLDIVNEVNYFTQK